MSEVYHVSLTKIDRLYISENTFNSLEKYEFPEISLISINHYKKRSITNTSTDKAVYK